MKKNNILPKLFISLVTISLLGCISGITYAWFSRQNNVNLDSIYQGTSAGAYFAYGSGTQDDPYGISEPRHLYNLAWLQYLGQFNEDKNNDGKIDSQYYFELANDIDMQGLVLPPIGTEDNPFIGNFDGNEFTVSNLTISNSIGSDNITNYPYTVTDDFNNNKPEVIGFFGVVGYLPADESKYSLGSVTVESGTDETEEPINQVHDLYLNNITVKNTSDKLLAGFLAGYVNGSMTNCGVHYCDFDIASGTTNIEDLSTSVSKYSYVGAINTDKYKIDGDTSGGGQDNDWGGSIDMRTLNRRLSYMYANGNIYSSTYAYSKSTSYRTYLSYGWSSFVNYDWNSTNDIYMSVLGGTIIPLNVDSIAMGIESFDNISEITSQSVGGTNFKSNQEYVNYKNNGEVIGDHNTGYLVGGSEERYSASIRTGIRTWASYTYGGVRESFKGANRGDSITYTTTGDDATNKKFSLFTLKGSESNWTTYRIIDDINKSNYIDYTDGVRYDSTELNLTEYKKVRENFDKAMNGSQTLHGFHFLQYLPDGTTTGTTLSNYIETSSVNILGTEMKNYQLVKGGLNFTVEKQGKISAIVGAGYTNGSHSLFDLYKVTRNSSNSITSMTQIEKIYLKENNNGTSEISYNSQPSSEYNLAIDIKSLSSASNRLGKLAAYYFEIPVSAGDYVIGTAKGSSAYNAYLMYLDIGANASSESSEDDKDTLTIDFVWAASDSSSVIALIKITDEAYVKSEVVLEITSDTSTTAKRSYFYYKRIAPVSSGTSTTFSYVYYYGDYGGLKIENIGTSGNAVAQPSKNAVENG